MRAIVALLIGGSVCALLARAARRAAVVDRLARRTPRRLLPSPLQTRLERALDAAVLDLPVASALQMYGAGVGAAGVLGFAVGSGAGAIACMLAVVVGAPIALIAARGRRTRMIAAAVPFTVERVASELRAGGTIATAVAHIARSDDPLAEDFRRLQSRLELGAPMTDALQRWSGERDAPGVDAAAGALGLCATIGGRAADALDGLASSLRDHRAIIAEARALSAQARMSAWVVGGIPFVYVGWSAIADRRALHALTGTPIGRGCVLVGLTLEAFGVVWMRRILRAGSVV